MNSVKRSLQYVFLGGVTTSAVDSLAVGPTLTAYALLFGAGDFSIGLLGAVPFIGNLMHLFASWLIEKGYSVKKISILSSFLSRPFYLIAALLAFVHNEPWALPCLIVSLALAYIIGCVCGGVWLPWMKALVPHKIMGRFFSHRFKWMMIAKIICFIFAFYLLRYVKEMENGELFAYAGLLFLAFLISLYAAYTFVHVDDRKIKTKSEISFASKVLHTFKNKPFTKLLMALTSLNFSINFLTPFLTVFMLKKLGVEMADIIGLTLLQWLVYVLIVKKWGKIADKQGPEKILIYSIPLFVLTVAAFMGLNMVTLSYLPLISALVSINILLGFATAALALGINNVSLLYIPEDMSAVYLSVNSVFKSLAGAVGSICAGLSFTVFNFTAEKLAISDVTLYSWNLFFLTTIALCVLSLFQLRQVKKCA